MQETLTTSKIYSFYYANKNHKKTPFKFIIMILFCIIFIITVMILINKFNNNYNKQEKYYLLSFNHSTSKSTVETFQEEVDEVVGVSYIYHLDGVYHVIGFIYYTLEEADENLSKVIKAFPNARVLIITQNKIKNNIYQDIEKNKTIKTIYEFECGLDKKIYSLCQSVDNGADEFKIYRELTLLELKLDENYSVMAKIEDSKPAKCLQLSHSVMIALIRDCKDEIIIGEDLLDNVKLLYIKVFIETCELKISLNDL